MTSSYVYVKNLRIHAYHGVLPHENIVGQDFIVSARWGVDISSSMEFPNVTSLDLTITKLNPPFGADCEGAGVEIHVVRE